MFTFSLLRNLWNYATTLACYLLILAYPTVSPRKWTLTDQSDFSNPIETCPPMCDCSRSGSSSLFPTITPVTTQNNYSSSKLQATSESILARCWVASNLIHLHCTPEWTILHLQILNGIIDHKKSSSSKMNNLNDNDEHDEDDDKSESHITIQPSNSLFTYCGSLTRLAIWEKSQFNAISRHLFQPLTNLIRLIIQAPKLQSLPNHFLIFTPKLKFLMISKCAQLKQFTPNVFEPCPKDLRTIWLNNNALSGRLHAGLFRQCNLNTLWLNDNQLELIDSGSLTGLENLLNLRLDHNSLKGSLEHALGITTNSNLSALIETPNLKIIDLSYNQLGSISNYHWSGLCIYHDTIHMGLCKLEELKLSYNQLKFISPHAFIGLPKLQKLDLEGNLQLYNTESIASLTVALHSLTFINIYLQRLILSIPIKSNTSIQFESTDICNSNSNIFLGNSIDLALKQVILQLNQTKCHRKNKTQIHSTPQTQIKFSNHTKPCNLKQDDDIFMEETLQTKTNFEQDSIVAYIRRANRLMLSLICIGILFTGGILTTCLFAFIHCLIRTNYLSSICHSNHQRPLSIMEDQIEPLITTPSLINAANIGHIPKFPEMAHENYLNSPFLNYSLKKVQPRPNIDLPPTPTPTSSMHISTNHLTTQREDYSSRYCIPILLGPYGSRLEIPNQSNRIQSANMTATTTAPTSPIAPPVKITTTRRNNSTSNMYARPQTILGLSGLNRHVKHQQSNKQCSTDPTRENYPTATTTTTNGSSYSLTPNQTINFNVNNNLSSLNRELQLSNGKVKEIKE